MWMPCYSGYGLAASCQYCPSVLAQLWEEGSGAATGEQPVLPAFVELVQTSQASRGEYQQQANGGKAAPSRAPFGREENDPVPGIF